MDKASLQNEEADYCCQVSVSFSVCYFSGLAMGNLDKPDLVKRLIQWWFIRSKNTMVF